MDQLDFMDWNQMKEEKGSSYFDSDFWFDEDSEEIDQASDEDEFAKVEVGADSEQLVVPV